MRKPLHNRYLGPALLLALWFALAEPLACIGYYHGRAPSPPAPAPLHHKATECAELANTNPRLCALRATVVQSPDTQGALPANPICLRAAGGAGHAAGAPPSPVHELLAEGSPQIQTIAWPHTLARAPQPCRPSAGPPPPTPPPRRLAHTSA